jgi:penicillin-binding protein 2
MPAAAGADRMQRDVRVVTPLARRRGRAAGARAGIALALLALACALFKLQVLDVQDYALVARANRLRSVTVAAPRGTIYDRHGEVVAENVVGYRIMLMPAPEDSLRAQLRRLTPVLGLTSSDVSGALRSWKRDPYRPMVVLADASARAVARMEERRFLFPAVLVDEYPKRHYVGGDAVGHFLGYVAEISQRQLAEPGFAGYAVGRMVGQAGLEASYEKTLGGEPGLRFLEVDAVGRIVRWLPAPTGVPALPGRDLQLYLDLDLQRYVRHTRAPAACWRTSPPRTSTPTSSRAASPGAPGWRSTAIRGCRCWTAPAAPPSHLAPPTSWPSPPWP